MAEIDVQKLLAGMRQQLEKDEADGKLAGLKVENLAEAIAHPEAPAMIAESLAAEAHSVQPGQPAPDFSLPWLPGHAGDEKPSLTLSSRLGARPVALIFGSYT